MRRAGLLVRLRCRQYRRVGLAHLHTLCFKVRTYRLRGVAVQVFEVTHARAPPVEVHDFVKGSTGEAHALHVTAVRSAGG